MTQDWRAFEPRLAHGKRSLTLLTSAVKALAAAERDTHQDVLRELLDDAETWPNKDRARIIACLTLLGDLCEQRWSLRVRRGVIEFAPPEEIALDAVAEKERVRRQELIKRNAQLGKSSTRAFIRAMERRQLYKGRFVSVFSLMRDGRELADALRRARDHSNGVAGTLDAVIDPYIQFVTPGEACPLTGLDLMDVWRYFRHTWTNQYVSVPGRSMMLLVRDRAADFHPVIGIAAISSPIVQIRERDEWIGWHPTTFIDDLIREPSDEIARWLVSTVDAAIEELYVADLFDRLEKAGLSRATMRTPNDKVIEALRALSAEEREKHHRLMRAKDLKNEPETSHAEKWEHRARSHLFTSKRAGILSDLLEARRALRTALSTKPSGEKLATFAQTSEGDRVIRKIVRKAKAERVGIALADITVCGAVQPYNAILGGKLVASLATSPEVIDAYRRRYGSSQSEIASAMAGRPIVRSPNLVFLGTTSLYGVGSSQYNRIKIPCSVLDGDTRDDIAYRELGKSDAFGTSQFSYETEDALERVVGQESLDRVNYIFGEGVSPKLRKLRQGLEVLGLSSEQFLRHGRRRIVYGVSLARNLRRYLLGLDAEPEYMFAAMPPTEASQRIARWWKQRWLGKRIENDAVLSELERHTLIHPITHGARVMQIAERTNQNEFAFYPAHAEP